MDEVFANTSTETVIENVNFSQILNESDEPKGQCALACESKIKVSSTATSSSPRLFDTCNGEFGLSSIVSNAELIEFFICQLVSEMYKVPSTLHCLFCLFNCTFEYILKDHIVTEHLHELEALIKCNTKNMFMCNLCDAKFFNKELLPNHLTKTHKSVLLKIFTNTPVICFTGHHLCCKFCSYKVQNECNFLLDHVVETHMDELSDFITESSYESIQFHAATEKENSPVCRLYGSVSPGLSNVFSCMFPKDSGEGATMTNTYSHTDSERKLVLKPLTNAANKETKDMSMQYQCGTSATIQTISAKRSVKRCLEFGQTEAVSCLRSGKNKPCRFKGLSHPLECNRNCGGMKSKLFSVFSLQKSKKNESKVASNSRSPCSLQVVHSSTKQGTRLLVSSTPLSSKNPSLKCKKHARFIHMLNKISKFKKLATKKLTFSLPFGEAHVCDMNSSYEPETKNSGNIQSTGDSEGESHGPLSANGELKLYKCGLCGKEFSNHADILKHAKYGHRKVVDLLQPLYQCGQCKAKFFRDSYLIRHILFHHTPQCFRNKCQCRMFCQAQIVSAYNV